MTEPQLQELLDMAYEFESLITLALSRQGAPNRIHALIEAKAYAIADAAAAYAEAQTQPESQPATEKPGKEQAPEKQKEPTLFDPMPIAAPEPKPVPELEPEPEPTPTPAPEPIAQPEPELKPAPIPITPKQEPAPKARALRTYFALNDKYRFRRELFGGDGDRMNSAIDTLAGIRNLTQAEDYIYSELGLDPDLDATQEFIEVITPYYS